ncbi:C6 zinc finger domain protein [Penicillium angulare]|uniref:C6 zinc finger domain protein n=1 Tax=Penicillium angulare TaxID=116970 RepID=UPI002541D697|nr:C6 zinc finger domain protein [Penicillium angulare]KAJ5272328.1 C6 zinc finger domain protein [Penicillium angulare]
MGSLDNAALSSTVAASSPKLYRQPRRRPAHLRTKTGCLTFQGRNRKKKCDEVRAPCLNCTKRHIECVWRRSPKLQRPDENVRMISETLKGEKRSIVVEDGFAIQPLLPSTFYTTHRVEAILRMPFTYSTAITPESGNLFDFLKQKFLPELIRPAAETHVIDTLSKETLTLALDSPFCMHALLACCGAEIPAYDQKPRDLARTHYTRSVGALRKHLSDKCLRSHWVATTLTVMMLCIYERSKPQSSTGVSIHLAGAARLIHLGSSGHLDSSSPTGIEKAMHRLVQESFIFHVATSLPFQNDFTQRTEIETAFSLAEEAVLPHFRPENLSYSSSPVLGFPPKLFRSIYTAYRLYQESKWGSVDFETCRSLEYDLRQWSDHIAWLEFGSGSSSGRVPQNHDVALQQATGNDLPSTALLGPRLYVIGCHIILSRMMSPIDGRRQPDLEKLIQKGIKAVGDLQPGQDYFAEYYCWPLLVIGMHLTSKPDKDLLMDQVRAFWKATNNGTMRRLADMLDIFWKSL